MPPAGMQEFPRRRCTPVDVPGRVASAHGRLCADATSPVRNHGDNAATAVGKRRIVGIVISPVWEFNNSTMFLKEHLVVLWKDEKKEKLRRKDDYKTKGEQRTFGNGRLRDQWEKIAQSEAEECKQEAERKEKSTCKISASKWNYHWTLVATGDFKKVTSGTNDAEKNKPKIKFKIVPPPPKAKAEPPPPPPPKKQASPKLRREKRIVEVDVFRLLWKDSWMSLKPPKYLYLKPKAMKSRISGFTTIELKNNRKYKPIGYRSEAELECLDKWSHSWKQVKSPVQLECSDEKQFQWEILFERKNDHKVELELYSLPPWAGTWKFINFPFRQQKKDWDNIWPDYQPNISRIDEIQQLKKQFHKLNSSFSSWKQSWIVAVAYRPGDENEDEDEVVEGEEWKAWKESWKICHWKKPAKDDIVCFSTEHRSQRYMGLMHEEEGMLKSEWTLSWKMNNTAAKDVDTEKEEEEEEEEEDEEES
ncbi:hypothetical protein D9C73_019139 [Collichthys lucidus]|uniref:Uncharacterized protein n=1 Tax=Collichthys lucidus TaxID=240159 RepID=A0A4U5V860_COLLU|nr:hypothetical protein D9C73_019139 [Collichthys lucidus]